MSTFGVSFPVNDTATGLMGSQYQDFCNLHVFGSLCSIQSNVGNIITR